MVMSYEEAVAAVTAPGQPFSIIETEVLGQPVKVYENIFPSLRTLWDTARGRGDETFLVYEDERLSFAEVMAQVDAIAAMLVDHYGVGQGRPGRHRHAQLPGVDHLLRRHHLDRRHRRVAQRLVDGRRDGLRPRGLGHHACSSPIRSGPSGPRARSTPSACAPAWCARRARCRPAPSGWRTCSSPAHPCRPSTCTPTTTPPSSTRRAPPAIPRARCRPIGRSCTVCSPSPAGPR